jgi:hypothetical protein
MRARAVSLSIVVLAGLAAGCGSSDTIVKGHQHIEYHVNAPDGLDSPLTVIYSDPATGDVSTTSVTTAPWVKTYEVDDPDAVNVSVQVDDDRNGTAVNCAIIAGGKIVDQKNVAAGNKDRCAALHL